METACHLVHLKRLLEKEDSGEENMSNSVGTHFINNLDTRKTLGFSGDGCIRYADGTSGDEGMPMILQASGDHSAGIEPPLLIFKDKDSNYPLKSPADIDCTAPEECMDQTLMLHWLGKPKVKKHC